jgi:hypothetical protein
MASEEKTKADAEKTSGEKEKKELERRAFIAQAKKEYKAVPPDNSELKQATFGKWLDAAETFEEIQETYKAASDEGLKKLAWLRLAALISKVPLP